MDNIHKTNRPEKVYNYLKSGNTSISDFVKYSSSVLYSEDYAKSLELSLMGLKKAPLSPVFNRIAMYSSVPLGKNEDAIKYADALFNKSDKPEINYYDYTNYGQALSSLKQYDLAIEQFRKAIKLDSTQIGFWTKISDLYEFKQDYKSSIAAYSTYMKSLPVDKVNNPDIIIALAKKYYSYGSLETTPADIKKASLQTADSIFAKVAELEPTSYRGNFYRARTNLALDPDSKTDVAKGFYEQTLAFVESKADVRYNQVLIESCRFLGGYYYQKRDYVKSKTFWEKILTIEPKNELAIRLVDAIDKAQKGKK